MTENWRPIATAPEYAVSDLGRVKRVLADIRYDAGRVLRPSLNTKGYRFVTLCSGGQRRGGVIHRLVCEAFHGPAPTPVHEVAHNDGNRLNNVAGNLRWATRKENLDDRRRHGTIVCGDQHPSRLYPERRPRGEGHANSKLTEADVHSIRSSAETLDAAARRFGISRTNVWDIRRGRTWRHLLAA